MMASLGGVSALTGTVLFRFAASLAFAICSLKAFEEFSAFFGVALGESPTSCFRAALAWAIELRKAADELGTLRAVPADSGGEGAAAVPRGDIACPKVSTVDVHALDALDRRFLLLDMAAGLVGV